MPVFNIHLPARLQEVAQSAGTTLNEVQITNSIFTNLNLSSFSCVDMSKKKKSTHPSPYQNKRTLAIG
jgi:hypothetical protein